MVLRESVKKGLCHIFPKRKKNSRSDEKTFDIFGLHGGLKVKNKLMIYLFCSAFLVILLNFWIAKSNYYIIRSD